MKPHAPGVQTSLWIRLVFLPYLFGRSVAIVLLAPKFGLHLQPDVLKVNAPVHRLHITLGHVVGCRLPVAAVREIRQLLPAGTRNNSKCT